mgnify:CR=1 FL=1
MNRAFKVDYTFVALVELSDDESGQDIRSCVCLNGLLGASSHTSTISRDTVRQRALDQPPAQAGGFGRLAKSPRLRVGLVSLRLTNGIAAKHGSTTFFRRKALLMLRCFRYAWLAVLILAAPAAAPFHQSGLS